MRNAKTVKPYAAIFATTVALSLLSFATPSLMRSARAQQVDNATLKCLKVSGNLGTKCTVKALKALRDVVSPTVGPVTAIPPSKESKVNTICNTPQSLALGYRDRGDLVDQINDGCELFALDLNSLVYDEAQVGLTPDQLTCRLKTYKWLEKVHKVVGKSWGKKCTLADYQQKPCDRVRRDERIVKIRAKAENGIEKICGADFDVILTFPGATLQDRIATFVDLVVIRGRHWAERVYPPNNGGPTADFGVFNIGLKTLNLEDPSRLNVPGDAPRPITVEVYYPATDAAIAGVPQDVASVLGINLFTVPAYRDVDIAPGPFPVILFSHGSSGIRTQSFFFTGQLASHGFIVISPDHHGNTIPDAVAGIVDPDVLINRPLDISFLIDEFTTFNATPGDFFEGELDLTKIGMSGHSLGGYTTLALAGGPFALGTFTDNRIKAIFPQAPAGNTFFFDPPTFFPTITVPTLIVGGTIDETTPFLEHQQTPFDNLPSGASVVGLAEVVNAGHFTFSSICEIDPSILAFLGGFEEGCEPRHLPWRHAQELTMYLAENFFDGILNGNATALARIDPAVVAQTFDSEDILYQTK